MLMQQSFEDDDDGSITDKQYKLQLSKLAKPWQVDGANSMLATYEDRIAAGPQNGLPSWESRMSDREKTALKTAKEMAEIMNETQQQIEKELNSLFKAVEKDEAAGDIKAALNDSEEGEKFLKKYGRKLVDLISKRQKVYNQLNKVMAEITPWAIEGTPIDEFLGRPPEYLETRSLKMGEIVDTIIFAIKSSKRLPPKLMGGQAAVDRKAAEKNESQEAERVLTRMRKLAGIL